MANCPCKRRKAGSIPISCSQNCEFSSWHAECAGFLNIVNKKQVEDLGEWNCPNCAMKALKMTCSPSSESDVLAKFDEHLTTLKGEINDLKDIKEELSEAVKQNEEGRKMWSDIVKNGIPEASNHDTAMLVSKIADKVVQKSNEVKNERDAREKNVILFNVVESTQTNTADKQREDQDFFDHFCEQIQLQPIQTTKIVRIGKVKPPSADDANTSTTPKPRPVKVCFGSVFDKRKFLSNLYHLKQAAAPFKAVQVNHDLTDEDRTLTKQLLKDAHSKNESENPTDFLYKVRGPPGAIKVVKVYHRQ